MRGAGAPAKPCCHTQAPLPRLWTRSLTLYGLRPEFLEKSGALLFIWTLYVLGVTGGLSVILAVQALRDRRVAS